MDKTVARKGTLVISGASSGLGKAIMEHLSSRFEKIITIGRHVPDRTLMDCPDATHISMDFIYPFDVADNLKRYVTDGCDVLINCAGYMPLVESNDFLDYTDVEEANVLTVNFESHYHVIKHFMDKAVSENRKLSVISIASSCGVKPDAVTPLYAACKAGIIALTEGLCTYKPELIRLNCISPGFFNTNLVPGDAPQELLDACVPQKREAQPKEILPVVDMILESSFMTGSNIIIDGGQVRK